MQQAQTKSVLVSVVSGLFGGLAEVLWIYLYCLQSDVSLQQISNEIVLAVHLASTNQYQGLLIHFALSIIIGIAYGKIVLRRIDTNNLGLMLIVSTIIFACIWMCAFKIILPHLNMDMVTIVPYYISLPSKILFGACMTLVYYFASRSRYIKSACLYSARR